MRLRQFLRLPLRVLPALLLTVARLAAIGPDAAPRLLTLEGTATAEVLSVLSGGLKSGSASRSLVEAAVQADFAALGVSDGTLFRASGLWPQGDDLSGDHLGDLQGVTNIAAFNQPLLYELWLAGRLAGGRIDVRAGRLLADTEFAVTEAGGGLLNSSFGWPAFISANTRNTGPAFHRTALGLHCRVRLREGLTWQVGLYDGDTFDDPAGDPASHANGLHIALGGDQGAFAIIELAWELQTGPAAVPRPATVKFGAWGHTAEFPDQRDPGQMHSGNHGFYAVAERMLWRAAAAGPQAGATFTLSSFVRVGLSPASRNRYSTAADAGLAWVGPLPGRDADTLTLGLACVRLGRATRQAEREAGTAVVSDHELVCECSYNLALGDRWLVIPDVQWIHHPGGSRALPDALVAGVRTSVSF